MEATLEALARAIGARQRGGSAFAAARVARVVTDSRLALGPGTLFVALRGPHHDGHAFVGAALAAGASAVCDAAGQAAHGAGWQGAWLEVDDTLRALGALGAHARTARPGPVVAITGSNGKTTTKELVYALLAARGPAHRTLGNLNNLIGVPQTLLDWPADAWAAAVEMGMNAPGEIAQLTAMARPDVGVITGIAAAHLGGPGLGSLAAIAAAKVELLANLPDGATAVLHGDDPVLMAAAAPHLAGRPRLLVGWGDASDVRIRRAAPTADGLAVTLDLAGTPCEVALPLIGRHHATNAGLAAAAALVLGIDATTIAAALPGAAVPGARLRLGPDVAGRPRLLDDSYNANPGSMAAAFAAQADVAGRRRRVAVLGEMLELGHQAEHWHARVGAEAAAAGIARIWALGPHAAATAAAARAGGAAADAFADLAALGTAVQRELGDDDLLLVKGSRGMQLERLVAQLAGRLQI